MKKRTRFRSEFERELFCHPPSFNRRVVVLQDKTANVNRTVLHQDAMPPSRHNRSKTLIRGLQLNVSTVRDKMQSITARNRSQVKPGVHTLREAAAKPRRATRHCSTTRCNFDVSKVYVPSHNHPCDHSIVFVSKRSLADCLVSSLARVAAFHFAVALTRRLLHLVLFSILLLSHPLCHDG